jgi:O-antigen/teichoic acid export membrane protein
VDYSVKCMGMFVGLNLPVMILQGVFVGREQQIKLNALYIPYSLARTIGVLLVIFAFPDWRSIEKYFLIQVFIQITYVILLIVVLSKEFAAVLGALSFRFLYLKRGWKFSRGVLLISITSIFVVQIDKLYLSGNSSLADYAAYSLASTLAGFPYIFSTALNSVLFPRFSISLDAADESKVVGLFGISCAVITFLMIVLCVAAYFFSGSLLALFFAPELATSIGRILPILLIGTALQSVLIVPFALQLAAKWTSLALRLNLIWIPIVSLLLPALVHKFGVVGGAYAWLIYNVFSTTLTFMLVARRFSFLKAVNTELLRILAVTLISSVAVCYAAKAIAAAFMDTYAALAFEMLCVLVVVLVGGYIFRKKLVHFS